MWRDLALHWAVPAAEQGSGMGLASLDGVCWRHPSQENSRDLGLPATSEAGRCACGISFIHLQAQGDFPSQGALKACWGFSVPKTLSCFQRSVSSCGEIFTVTTHCTPRGITCNKEKHPENKKISPGSRNSSTQNIQI